MQNCCITSTKNDPTMPTPSFGLAERQKLLLVVQMFRL